MIRNQCPNADHLRAFHHGKLEDGEVEALSAHLDQCRKCEITLDRLDAETDDIVATLRESPPTIVWSDRESFLKREQRQPEVPGFEILGEAGRGGMGVVFKARQSGLERIVAIKVVLNGTFAKTEALDRLRREAKAAAALRHPNIVQVYDVGEYDGLPYLTMEWVEGSPLDARLAGRPLSPRDAAHLVVAITRGVQHAHEKGVIHRDLKPANVLLQETDNTPKSKNQLSSITSIIPKVSDFGLARRSTTEDRLTATGVLAGSPSYMAPEQTHAGGNAGPSADIYALGAILYECLTGRPPFLGDDAADTLLRVRSQDPLPPRNVIRSIPRDMETICLKCLNKEPGKRYQSAAELADDLERFLDERPIRARRIPLWYRTWLWAKRRPALASALAALLLVTLIGFGLVTTLWRHAEREAVTQAKLRREGQRLSAGLTIEQGLTQCEQGDITAAMDTLARGNDIAASAEEPNLERVAQLNLGAWKKNFNRERFVCSHGGWVNGACFNRDKSVLLTASQDHSVRRWNATDGQPIGQSLDHGQIVEAVSFSPDDRWILSGGGTEDDSQGSAWLWDAKSEQLVAQLPHPSHVTFVGFSADGSTFITVCAQEARIWSTTSRQQVCPPLKHGTDKIRSATMSHDKRYLLTGGSDKTARIWISSTGQPVGEPLQLSDEIVVVLFSPDGQAIATADKSNTAQLWDVKTGAKLGQPMLHNGLIKAVAFSGDSQFLATGGQVDIFDPVTHSKRRPTGEARIWRARTGADWISQMAGRPLGIPLSVSWPVWSVALNPVGTRMLAGSGEGMVRLYETATGQQIGNALAAGGTVKIVEFLDEGRTALTATAGTTARLWDLAGESLAVPPILSDVKPRSMALSPDGRSLIVGSNKGQFRFWDLARQQTFGPVLDLGESSRDVIWKSSGEQLITVGAESGLIKVWNATDGKLLHMWTLPEIVRYTAFLDDGQTFLTAQRNGQIDFWDAGSFALLPNKSFKTEGVLHAAIHSSKPHIFVAAYSKPVSEWDLQTGKKRQSFPWADWDANCTISPDGQTLLTGSAFGRYAQLWNVSTGGTMNRPLAHVPGGQSALAISPDGRMAATGSFDHAIRLWDVATGYPLGPPLHLGASPLQLLFTRDGRQIIALGESGIRIWDVPNLSAESQPAVYLP